MDIHTAAKIVYGTETRAADEKMVCRRCGVRLVFATRSWKHAPGIAGVRGCRWALPIAETVYNASVEAALDHALEAATRRPQ